MGGEESPPLKVEPMEAQTINPAPAGPPRVPCKGCQRLILFATAASGAQIPIDPDPTPAGNLLLSLRGGVLHSEYVKGEVEANRRRYVSHFSTCPEAAQYRKGPGIGRLAAPDPIQRGKQKTSTGAPRLKVFLASSPDSLFDSALRVDLEEMGHLVARRSSGVESAEALGRATACVLLVEGKSSETDLLYFGWAMGRGVQCAVMVAEPEVSTYQPPVLLKRVPICRTGAELRKALGVYTPAGKLGCTCSDRGECAWCVAALAVRAKDAAEAKARADAFDAPKPAEQLPLAPAPAGGVVEAVQRAQEFMAGMEAPTPEPEPIPGEQAPAEEAGADRLEAEAEVFAQVAAPAPEAGPALKAYRPPAVKSTKIKPPAKAKK